MNKGIKIKEKGEKSYKGDKAVENGIKSIENRTFSMFSEKYSPPSLPVEGWGNSDKIYAPVRISPPPFSTMTRMGLLCDVCLVAGGLELRCHKSVLAACSQYFFAMFTNEMSEAKVRYVRQFTSKKSYGLFKGI